MSQMTLKRKSHRKVAVKRVPEVDEAWDASLLRAVWDRVNPEATPAASAAGCSVETLRMWRQGRYCPNAVELQRLAQFLGVTVDDVLPPLRPE